jgi:hypothetical protein
MGFLGRLSSSASKFLGRANQAASFLGRNLHHVSSGLKSVQQFSSHPDVQRIGSQVGISPNVFRSVNQVASTLGNAVNLLPTLGNNLRTAGQAGLNSVPESTKRSLADLYQQANTIGT